MKAQTWYRIHGDPIKIEVSSGSLNQMIMKPSMGWIMASRGGFTPRCFSAETAGSLTTVHSLSAKPRLSMKATASPMRDLIMRERSSSRCSMKDMRSMPSSSSSLPEGGGGSAGGRRPEDPTAGTGGGGADMDGPAPSSYG